MIVTGENRSTGKKSVPVPIYQHEFHIEFPGIDPWLPSCGNRGNRYLKFHIFVHVGHILFISP
jgi:hypothetical protein